MTREMRTVVYTGPYGEVTVPGRPSKLVRRMTPIAVPADLKLCKFWRDAEADDTAPIKDGE